MGLQRACGGTGKVLPHSLSLDGLCHCLSDVYIKVPQMSPPPRGIPEPYFRKRPSQHSSVPILPYFCPCVLSLSHIPTVLFIYLESCHVQFPPGIFTFCPN